MQLLSIIGTMASSSFLLLFLVFSLSPIEPKHVARRSADALVKPQLPKLNDILSSYKWPMRKDRFKEKCKVKPLKARTYIKADTIFIGTVMEFYTQPNLWMKQMDASFLRKGNVKYFWIYWVLILRLFTNLSYFAAKLNYL